MPSELVPGETEVTVRFSVNSPKVVSNTFVKAAPIVTGVGLVRLMIVVEAFKSMLFVIMLVINSGAPDVMVFAVVTSPVSAVRVPVGTNLNTASIVSAKAGEAAIKAAQATAAISALLEFTTLMTVPISSQYLLET